jgi:hypothetical protein
MESRDWAISIGVGDYLETHRLHDLPGARRDAEGFYEWVASHDGGAVPEKQRTLLISASPQDPRAPSPVAHGIKLWFRQLVDIAFKSFVAGTGFRVGRRLYIFAAGHGVSLGDELHTALLTAEANPPITGEHFAGGLFAEWFRVARAFEEVFLAMDCCRTEMWVRPEPPSYSDDQKSFPPAKHFYAFAVANGTETREAVVNRAPGGHLTTALLRNLREAPRPLTASGLKGLLYRDLRGPAAPVIKVPDNPLDDFEILPARLPTDNQVVVIHDDSEVGAKVGAAHRLEGGRVLSVASLGLEANTRGFSRAIFAIESPSAVHAVQGALGQGPVAVYSHGGSSLGLPLTTPLVRAHETDSPALALLRSKAALDHRPTATLSVRAEDPLARVLVWTERGVLVAESYGHATVEDIPLGRYQVRALLGAADRSIEVDLTGNTTQTIAALDIDTPFPLPGSRRWAASDAAALAALPSSAVLVVHRGLPDVPRAGCGDGSALAATTTAVGAWRATAFDAAGRVALELAVEGGIARCIPTAPQHRTEVYVDADGTSLPAVSIRVVADRVPPGTPLPTDRTREVLRTILAAEGPSDRRIDVRTTDGDAIASLLALALARDVTASDATLTAQAASVLGEADDDVRVWRGEPLMCIPTVSRSWTRALERGLITAAPADAAAPPADGMVGRLVSLRPWLAWSTEDRIGESAWLRGVATAAWPGWELHPELAQAATGLSAAAIALRAPADSLRRRLRRSPPVPRLIAHDRISFVGASNDQLAAALSIAFVERKHRRWRDLTVWSLDDAPLAMIASGGVSGDALLWARDQAEDQLLRLLPLVADGWHVHRYAGLDIDDKRHFASLWDWKAPGGYVHVSAYDGVDLRSSVSIDEEWPEPSPAPPATYCAVVLGHTALRPTSTRGRGSAAHSTH